MSESKVSFEEIESFLVGRDPQKYIVGIEATYYENFVSLIINDPEKGKYIEKHTLTSFLWMKHEVVDLIYNGDRSLIKKAMRGRINIIAPKYMAYILIFLRLLFISLF